MKPKVIAILVMSLLVAIVLLQNTREVTYRLLFWKLEVSQLLLIIVTLAVGFVAGFATAKLTGKGGSIPDRR